MRKFILTLTILFWVSSAQAATRYLDSSVAVSGDGTSWATAWKNFSNVTGLRPDDVVLISGGLTGQTYNTGTLLSPNGTSGHPIIYRVGQDAGHNGLVTIAFDGSSQEWIWSSAVQGYGNYITIDGNYNGQRNMTVTATNANLIVCNTGSRGITVRYITTALRFSCSGGSNIEIDHVYFTLNNGIDGITRGMGNDIGAVGYTENLVHDSIFEIAVKGDGIVPIGGDDGMQYPGNISIYNNIFRWIKVIPYLGAQHADGIQTCNPYIAIYNNYFEGNISNYPFFGDCVAAKNVGHWRIYNNVFKNNSQQNIAMGCDSITCTMDDVIIANNTVVDAGNCIDVNQGTPGTWTNVKVVNNICYNSGGITVTLAAGSVISNNTTSTTNITFVNNATYPNGDFHLLATSASVIDRGINPPYLTSVFMTDKSGISRPQGSAWDIGAYEFVSGTIKSPPSSPVLSPIP